jgi:hypothetical protein
MDALFSMDIYGSIFSIYIRDLFRLEINVFLILAIAAVFAAVKFYRYKKNIIRLEPLLGVVKSRKN